jgi:hypothetical protein
MALFVDGVPAKITVYDFRRYHAASFPKLIRDEYTGVIEDAIAAVYAMFSGVSTIWDLHPPERWYEKTVLCYRLLVAWYLVDQYPDLTSNYVSLNGVPLKRKKVDGVDITFDTDFLRGVYTKLPESALAGLKSNDFGRKALLMIQSAAKRAMLRNSRYV